MPYGGKSLWVQLWVKRFYCHRQVKTARSEASNDTNFRFSDSLSSFSDYDDQHLEVYYTQNTRVLSRVSIYFRWL